MTQSFPKKVKRREMQAMHAMYAITFNTQLYKSKNRRKTQKKTNKSKETKTKWIKNELCALWCWLAPSMSLCWCLWKVTHCRLVWWFVEYWVYLDLKIIRFCEFKYLIFVCSLCLFSASAMWALVPVCGIRKADLLIYSTEVDVKRQQPIVKSAGWNVQEEMNEFQL